MAAYLDEKQTPKGRKIQQSGLAVRPFWHLERARIGQSRKVPIEVIVNGYPVKKLTRKIAADGRIREIEFDVPIERSSWIALRILGSSHTNPVFVLVGGKPIRASRRSANWCIDAVAKCWEQKAKSIRAHERKAADRAYRRAKAAYTKIREECNTD